MSYPQYFHTPAAEIAAATLRDRLSLYLRHVEMQHRRFLITRHGTGLAALVSLPDLHALEHVERHSQFDRDARRAQVKTHQDLLDEMRDKTRRGEDAVWRQT